MLGVRLGSAFDRATDDPGAWWLIDEPELHLGPQIVVPDLGGSPSTSRLDRLKKLPVYAAYGVPYAWLIDPLKGTLEIYGLESGSLNLVSAYEGQESVCAAPFDAIPLELRALWI